MSGAAVPSVFFLIQPISKLTKLPKEIQEKLPLLESTSKSAVPNLVSYSNSNDNDRYVGGALVSINLDLHFDGDAFHELINGLCEAENIMVLSSACLHPNTADNEPLGRNSPNCTLAYKCT